MASRRGFHQVRRSPRRTTAWGFGPNADPISLSASGNQLWSSGVVLDLESKATIVRLRGEVNAFLLSASAAGDGFDGAFGIGITTTEAFAVGGQASTPGALTDMDWDGWMWHRFFNIHASTATIADGVNAVGVSFRTEIDGKAMRVWDASMTLFGSVEVVENGTATGEVWADCRALVKLS